LEQVLHPQFSTGDYSVLTHGLGASPGAAVGRVYFTADAAVEAHSVGEKVILVRNETSPEDVHGMLASEGILTARGGLVSHAAVVARGWGKPAVVGAEAIRISSGNTDGATTSKPSFSVDGAVVEEGEWLSIDGTSGVVVVGQIPLATAEVPPELEQILVWADEIRAGKMGVRANADNGPDAANARKYGAEGIGLCRTEHMFLLEDRLPIVRRMILAGNEEEENIALEELRVAQRSDFVEILREMDGLPVVVRLLDPPLHEFLPRVEDLLIKRVKGELSSEEERLYQAAREWQEANPMLGTRGVRLGVIKPGLYSMQVKALMEAALIRIRDGGSPVVEVMIPLTISRNELHLAREWVVSAVDEVLSVANASERERLDVKVGTMIETPRAALLAGEIANEAEFFSFGTNDLTQMTFGFSRDDVEGRMMSRYLELGLIEHNPFETVDAAGVGELVRIAVERGRATRTGLSIGVCGEHGGDPASIAVFADAGVDYVSCSPFRVPVARLASAHAVMRS
jgi:pyruvate,orthophosphate dikinase